MELFEAVSLALDAVGIREGVVSGGTGGRFFMWIFLPLIFLIDSILFDGAIDNGSLCGKS